jgi:peptidoglycan/LPS O-acetylase OafA/YrhL
MNDTFEGRLRAADRRPTGFDYLRVVLASTVLGWHVVMTGYGVEFQNQLLRSGYCAPVALVLPMFFALSGFLVAGSLDRSNTLIMFLGLRAFRIVPALAVEVFLSALILDHC